MMNLLCGFLACTLSTLPVQDEAVSLDDVPDAVRKSIEREFGADADVQEIIREEDEGEAIYLAEGDTVDGLGVKLELTESGAVLRRKRRHSETDLPEKILAAIKREAPGASFDRAKSDSRPDRTIYEVDLVGDAGDIELAISGNGRVLIREDKVELSALPKVVRKAVESGVGLDEVDGITAVTRYGRRTIYVLDITGADDVTITGDGLILEATLKNAPEAVRARIERELGAHPYIDQFERRSEDGEFSYKVAGEKVDGQEVELTISSNGTVLKLEKRIEESALPEKVRATVKEEAPDGTFDTATIRFRPDRNTYMVGLDSTAGEIEIVLTEEGRILERTDEIYESDLPAAVKTAINGRIGEAFLESIIREGRYGRKPMYYVEAEVDGEQIELEITADGTILD